MDFLVECSSASDVFFEIEKYFSMNIEIQHAIPRDAGSGGASCALSGTFSWAAAFFQRPFKKHSIGNCGSLFFSSQCGVRKKKHS